MRNTWTIPAMAALILCRCGGVQAEEKDEARAVVAKAIEAIGGEEKLAKLKAQTWTEKGTYYGMGDGLPFTGKYAVQWPGQFRMEIEGFFIIVLDGDKGWVKMGDDTKEMTKQELAKRISDQRGSWITTLFPLKDKAFTLTPIEGVKVEDRPTVGVKVTRKDYPEVKLYFDKTTNLLVKCEYRTKAPEMEYKEVTAAVVFSNYKEYDERQGTDQDGCYERWEALC